MSAEPKEPQAPDFDYYDAAEEEEEGGRGPILAVVGLIVLAAFGGVVYVAFQQGKKEGQRLATPVLHADAGPTKEIPAPAAGAAPADARVYDALEGTLPEEPEQLLPPPEEPMAAAPAAPVATPTPAPSAPAAVTPSAPAPQAAPTPQAAPPTPVPVDVAPAPTAKVATAEPAPIAAPNATEPSSLDPGAPQFLVQVGSYKTSEEALQSWQKMSGKFGDLLKGFNPNVAAVELGDRGTYHRLRFGPFSDREGATSVCQQLKERKQDCLIVKL